MDGSAITRSAPDTEIPRRKRWQRRFVRFTIRPFLPTRCVHDAGGLQRAASLARSGYGTLVLMNHFSLRDGLQVLHLLFSNGTLCRRPTLAPAAVHHLQGSSLPRLADRVGVRLLPIATPESVERHGLSPGSGVSPLCYARQAITTLDVGGIVLLAPQVGRRPALGTPRSRPVSLLMAQAHRRHVHDIALLFVGLGIEGETDYRLDRVGGLNLCRRYEVRIGHTFTLDEALEAAGGLRQLDDWTYRQLRNWVPAAYATGNGTGDGAGGHC